jgi:hypothetical protein
MWKIFPATTPIRISTSATEIPRRMEMRLARSARAIHTLATSQTFISTATPPQREPGSLGSG